MSVQAAAQTYGARVADKLLAGRKGHGGGPCSRRVLYRDELAAIAAAAFEAGAMVALRQNTGETK